MKHYLCVEEGCITYVCGTYGRGGLRIRRAASERITPGERERALKLFVRKNRLKGKRVTYVFNGNVFLREFLLPAAGGDTLRRMLQEEASCALGDENGYLTAIGRQEKEGPGKVRVLAYVVPRYEMNVGIELLSQSGIRVERAVAAPDCAGRAFGLLYPEYETLVLAEIGEDRLGLRLISRGSCVVSRNTGLGEREMFEKAAEEISRILRFYGRREPERKVQGIFIADRRKREKGFWKEMEDIFKIPCRDVMFPGTESGNGAGEVCPGVFFALAADGSGKRPENLIRAERRASRGSGIGESLRGGRLGIAMAAAVNLLFFAGILFGMEAKADGLREYRDELRAYVDAPEGREALKMARRYLDGEGIQLPAAQKDGFARGLYTAAEKMQALSPEILVADVRYEEGEIRLGISVPDPSLAPECAELLTDAGIFERIFYEGWSEGSKEGSYEAVIYGVPGGEG